MPGPLVNVGTIMAGVDLDVSRQLNMGNGITLEFIVPDQTQVDNWRVLATLTRGFDRIRDKEKIQGNGADLIVQVADLSGTLRPTIRSNDLHIRLEGQIHKVSKTPPVASDEAQVFDLICKTPALRTNFDVNL